MVEVKLLGCRLTNAPLDHVFLDLGMSPLSNSFLRPESINEMEPFYPLKVFISSESLLVQIPELERAETIFNNYAYFSSYSDSWLRHAKAYVDMMIDNFGFGPQSMVVELASNDGYLLQYFKERGVPVLGVEPAANVAEAAKEKGIPTRVNFFGVSTAREMAREGISADLIVGNNVLAHVPDINDFLGGMKILLKPDGVITVEFPHLARLMELNQFDTIYHEHFSYFSFFTAEKAFRCHGLEVFDVEELSTHGGSLRLFVRHAEDASEPVSDRVTALQDWERKSGFETLETYLGFAPKVEKAKRALLTFLIRAREEGKIVVGYGAPAKGNTLLNYCGIRTDFLEYTVDRNPHKQGLFLPGTHIPIYPPERIGLTKPDYVLILPWNIKDEVMEQMAYIRRWGGKFVVPIPTVEVFE